jgi:hypothetical protein
VTGASRDADIAEDEDLSIVSRIASIPVAAEPVRRNRKQVLNSLTRVSVANLKVHLDLAVFETGLPQRGTLITSP